jgi:hypothetical protein
MGPSPTVRLPIPLVLHPSAGGHQVLFHDPTGAADLLGGAYVSTANSGRAQRKWGEAGLDGGRGADSG